MQAVTLKPKNKNKWQATKGFGKNLLERKACILRENTVWPASMQVNIRILASVSMKQKVLIAMTVLFQLAANVCACGWRKSGDAGGGSGGGRMKPPG